MSNKNNNFGENHGQKAAETVFAKIKTYPYAKSDKISTEQFLETCAGVILLIEALGKAFAPIKHDIQGNITKINKRYQEDANSYQYVQDMILSEKSKGQTTTTDALQWLRRGLHFFISFFKLLIEDYEEQVESENLSGHVKAAYTESLERYHTWLGRQLFSVLSKFVPNRTDLMNILSSNNKDAYEDVVKDMKAFTDNLDIYVETLTEFYEQNSLETYYRV